ncbi:sensor histidine kinase [Pseudonocardia humida]|uniref:histidine kinase n=1 Tax=Pseudonocardia humida TaxID=2800819 RepID=A0ABT1A5A5_9PSEU|nr:sensor histidine kinase [Pseudonocardia humida]MCO1658201.1 sensor histidine kinase [Pseudonocardia humida]
MIGRLRRLPVWVADGALALVIGYADAIAVSEAAPLQVVGRMQLPIDVATLVVVLGALPLVVRRLAPLPVVVFVAAVALAGGLLLVPTTWLALVLAMYTVAAHHPRRQSLVIAAVLMVCVIAVLAVHDAQQYTVSNALVLAAVTALGDRTRVARLRAVALEQRARELERERERGVRLALAAERTRMAHELHDITAHAMAVIAVQSAGARRVLHSDPARAAEALGEIEDTARDGLAELRQAVALLRGGSRDAVPQPGLPELAGLVTRFRDAGLRVDAELPDPLPRLTPAVGLTVYRVVQEALTNALRHAGRTRARVGVTAGPDEVRVVVHDDGPGAGVPRPRTGPPGHGLLGLRERVRARGGHLDVRAGPDGFRLDARIPVAAPAAVEDGAPVAGGRA